MPQIMETQLPNRSLEIWKQKLQQQTYHSDIFRVVDTLLGSFFSIPNSVLTLGNKPLFDG